MNAAPVSKMLMPQSRANMWLKTKQTARAKWTNSPWQGPQKEAAKGKVGWDSVFQTDGAMAAQWFEGSTATRGSVVRGQFGKEKSTALDAPAFICRHVMYESAATCQEL